MVVKVVNVVYPVVKYIYVMVQNIQYIMNEW